MRASISSVLRWPRVELTRKKALVPLGGCAPREDPYSTYAGGRQTRFIRIPSCYWGAVLRKGAQGCSGSAIVFTAPGRTRSALQELTLTEYVGSSYVDAR